MSSRNPEWSPTAFDLRPFEQIFQAIGVDFDRWIVPQPLPEDGEELVVGTGHLTPQFASFSNDSWDKLHAIAWETTEACLVFPFPIPEEVGFLPVDQFGGRVDYASAFLHEVVEEVPSGCRVVFFSTCHWLRSNMVSFARFREWLTQEHSVEWLIRFHNKTAALPAVHSSFQFALLVIRIGGTERGPNLTRLVDLGSVEAEDWRRIICAALQKEGGEDDHCIVLRDRDLGKDPWIQERYSRQLVRTREDATELGELVPFKELTIDISHGIHLTRASSDLRPVRDSGAIDDGEIPVFSGRSISNRNPHLGPPTHVITAESCSHKFLFGVGDILIRQVGQSSQCLQVVLVTEDEPTGAFGHWVIKPMLRPDIGWEERVLLAAYLRSTHARDSLRAHGRQLHLTRTLLESLLVPKPSPRMVAALSDLTRLEVAYFGWAEEIRQARDQLFAATSYRDAVPELLRVRQLHRERVTAGRQAGTLEYRVRNYFPHAIALRRELIRDHPPGKEKLDEILECAEVFLTYLGVLSVLNLLAIRENHPDTTVLNPSWLESAFFRLDWGRTQDLVERAASATGKVTEGLALPVSGLRTLGGQESRWRLPARALREARNDRSHLLRRPAPDLPRICERLEACLDELLEGCDFIADLGLVLVQDYRVRPSGKRIATFQFLRGASLAFPREDVEVSHELSRGTLGILDSERRFHSLYPWFLYEDCPECKRAETFIFNRLKKKTALYVAMETGHPLEKPLQGEWQELLAFLSNSS